MYKVGLWRSDDDGRTFVGPVEAANGGGELGINVLNLMLGSDGTLYVPYCDFEYKPEKVKREGTSVMNGWLVASDDGAITFGPSMKVLTQEINFDVGKVHLTTPPVWAVDQSGRFRDRLYVVWTDFRFGNSRLLFSSSEDRGASWSDPKLIDENVPDESFQYQPTIAVNNDGVLGIRWFDTRHSKTDDYDEYFTASVDGGNSFLPSVRVSSESSHPKGAGNIVLSPSAWRHEDVLRLTLTSAAGRWGHGGDYMGMTTDSEGTFHPFWADSRTGTFQIRTAKVRVQESEEKESKSVEDQNRLAASLLEKVELLFDAGTFPEGEQVTEIPIRMKNTSNERIYAPLKVVVEKFGSGMGDELTEFAPKILNASNKKSGEGAEFDYSSAVGMSGFLEPGAETEPIIWKLELQDLAKTPDLHLGVSGYVNESKS